MTKTRHDRNGPQKGQQNGGTNHQQTYRLNFVLWSSSNSLCSRGQKKCGEGFFIYNYWPSLFTKLLNFCFLMNFIFSEFLWLWNSYSLLVPVFFCVSSFFLLRYLHSVLLSLYSKKVGVNFRNCRASSSCHYLCCTLFSYFSVWFLCGAKWPQESRNNCPSFPG